jgi:hypothetical protein
MSVQSKIGMYFKAEDCAPSVVSRDLGGVDRYERIKSTLCWLALLKNAPRTVPRPVTILANIIHVICIAEA